jgi:hypothetical protein
MLPKGLKLIGLSVIACIDKEGKTKKQLQRNTRICLSA